MQIFKNRFDNNNLYLQNVCNNHWMLPIYKHCCHPRVVYITEMLYLLNACMVPNQAVNNSLSNSTGLGLRSADLDLDLCLCAE